MAPSSAERSSFSHLSRAALWRDLKDRSAPFNVLVVGGGIVGAAILRQMALQKIPDILLVEKGDFASGTSSASSRLIHAGIRYLEQVWNHALAVRPIAALGAFRFVWSASTERRRLGRLAPSLVKPRPIYLVVGTDDSRPVWNIALGVWIYYLMQIAQGQFFSPPRVAFSASARARLAPELDPAAVRAVFSFWDSETDDARLVIETMRSASQMGGAALSYVEFVRAELAGGIWTVELRDTETGEIAQVRTRYLVNAAGAHVDGVRQRVGGAASEPLVDRVAGSHLDFFPALADRSFYVTAGDGRFVFLLRREEDGLVYTRVGTTERELEPSETSDAPRPTRGEESYLLELIQRYLPSARVSCPMPVSSDAGIRPLRSQGGDGAFHKSREHDLVREPGACHVVGVKLTDHRRVADEFVRTTDWGSLGLQPSPSAMVPLRGEDNGRLYDEGGVADTAFHTMALHWPDVVWRRRGLLLRVLRRDDPEAFRKAFDETAAALGWDAERKESEWKRL